MNARWLAAILLPATAFAQSEHVPPDPPKYHVHDMSYREMAEMMGMDDRKPYAKFMVDELEWRDAEHSALAWDAAAWYGGDYDKVWIESEGEHADDATHSRTELAWDRIVSRWWSTRLGLRHDSGGGPARQWAAFGVAGLAPGFIEIEASAYVGEGGRTALRFIADYDLLLTQRLVLHPELELNAYGREDPARLIGSGISDLTLGLRLRYELRREIAPYAGIVWVRRIGESADFARAAGAETNEASIVAGLRVWF
jgi:copper resistance protein B